MLKICVNQINVNDMDKAIKFYCDKLNFEIEHKEFYPELVPLKHDGIHLILCQVQEPTNINYGVTAQSLINFQTQDLSKTISELKNKGVDFIHDTPQVCPIGHFVAFKDPSGNVHELVEFTS